MDYIRCFWACPPAPRVAHGCATL